MRKSIERIVAGTLASSILFQSCGQGFFIDEDAVEINRKLALNLQKAAEYNNVAIPLEMNLGKENLAYLNFLNRLTVNIIENPEVAKEFLNDPKKYLEINGIKDVEINLDEGMLKMVTMLADEEICSAIRENDVHRFLNLCKDRDMISVLEKSDITKIKEIVANNKETFNSISNIIMEDGNIDWDNFDSNPFVLVGLNVVVIPAVVVAVVAIVTGVGFWVAAAAATAGAIHTYVAFVNKTVITKNPYETNPNPDPHILQMWILKNPDLVNTYIMLNEYEEQQVNNFVNAIWEVFPEIEDSKVKKEDIKQFISLNISQFYQVHENM